METRQSIQSSKSSNNGFLPGMMLFNWSNDERFTWAIGMFKNNQTVLGWNVGGGEWDATGRVTWLPIYENNGRQLLHLGLGVTHRALMTILPAFALVPCSATGHSRCKPGSPKLS